MRIAECGLRMAEWGAGGRPGLGGHHPGEKVLEIDGGGVRLFEKAAGSRDLDADEPLARRKVQGDVGRELDHPALVLAFQRTEVGE